MIVTTHLDDLKRSGVDVEQRIRKVGEEIRTIAESVGLPAIGKIFSVSHNSHREIKFRCPLL